MTHFSIEPVPELHRKTTESRKQLTPRLQFLCSTCRQLVQHPADESTCLSVNGDQTIAYSELTIEMPYLRCFGRHFVFCSKKVSEIVQFQCRFSSNLIGLTAKEISGNKDK